MVDVCTRSLMVGFLLLLLLSGSFCSLLKANEISLYSKVFKGPSPLWYEPIMIQHCQYLMSSYKAVTGKDLISSSATGIKLAQELFMHPTCVILSHGIQDDSEGPVLNYGNALAMQLWKAAWEEFTSMPSRYTAEAPIREERESLLKKVTENGFIDNYSGIRISLDSTKFRIKEAIVWNIVIDNIKIGQAATFNSWEKL